MINKSVLFTFTFLLSINPLFSKTLHIGKNQQYANLGQAVAHTLAGDTLLFHAGIYTGGQYITDLNGDSSKWITLLARENEEIIIRGGSEAWHFVNPAYIRIQGFIFEGQTGNGVNFDDSGDYSTPAHHVQC